MRQGTKMYSRLLGPHHSSIQVRVSASDEESPESHPNAGTCQDRPLLPLLFNYALNTTRPSMLGQ